MNVTLEDIENVQRQIDNLKAQLEVKDKWKLPEYEDGSEYVINGQAAVKTLDNKYITKVGRRRANIELAKRCAKASKTRDLLEAYRDHIEPEWKDADVANKVYYIYISDGEYHIHSHRYQRALGTVYGSKETMTQICDALNKGEITL